MQKFWYHSPVRFYKTYEELEDMTNPQNTQFYGHKNPYPLEINSYHRFLVPNYLNEIPAGKDLTLWIVNEDEAVQIPCELGTFEGKLIRVSLICDAFLSGHFELRTDDETLFYSNCVQFVDSTDEEGRKYIRIATKHTYNKNVFSFGDQEFDWFVTNLPGCCLGEFEIDEDVDYSKTGEISTSNINDAWLEENVSYQFDIAGDNNILTFISVHSLNNDFYIDGTKRTRKEKPEIEEKSAAVTFKFSNQKDKNGLNILLNEEDIFNDVMRSVLSNDAGTVIYAIDEETAIEVKN